VVTEQYSFRKDLPTEHAAYSLTDSILHVWNSKIHTAVNFCDVAKAFNPLNTKFYPICHSLALLAHHILHISRIRVNIEAAVLWAKQYINTLVQILFI
jgi:hypothetical protein